MNLKLFCVRVVGCVSLAFAAFAESVVLRYESAPSPNGPWTPVDPAVMHHLPDGAAAVHSPSTQAYFRLRIESDVEGQAVPLVPLAEVPAATLEVARRHVEGLLHPVDSADDDDVDGWADAQFGPFAIPLVREGAPSGEPAYLELKLVSATSGERPKEGYLRQLSNEPTSMDRGYLIVSLDRGDLPVLEYNTEGPTPVERLLRRCGGKTPARIVRFGPTFWAAEDAGGGLIANLGTEPFKIPHDFAPMMQERFAGEIDTARNILELPPELKLQLSSYASYAELKEDFESSPVHKLLRERRAAHAGLQWDIEAGKVPAILDLRVGETNVFLGGSVLEDLVLHWEGVRELADVRLLRSGFEAVGRQAGSAPLTVRTSKGLEAYVLRVSARGVGLASVELASGEPFWRTKTWLAGAWGDQMHYYQLKDSDWCELVGCGPTAVAMLLGYWDRRGVPSAFYTGIVGSAGFDSLRLSDAPQEINTASRKAVLREVYHQLHELCDVICPPFTDSGATWPGDLIEGFAGYLHHVSNPGGMASLLYGKGNRLMNYSCSWAWDGWGDDWQVSGVRVANGIKEGRPGIIGLGWLWHYGVAYGYRRKEYVVPFTGGETVIQVKRYFRVNEGWSDFAPSWYNAHDVFLGLTANMTQARTPQMP